MNLYPAKAFLRHLLTARSTAGHGVHSPFVFDFLTRVVKGKGDPQIIFEVERLRMEMLVDRRTVRVTDLGAGSAVHKGEERRVSEIAATAALPARQAALLSRIAGSLRDRSQRMAETMVKSGTANGHHDMYRMPPPLPAMDHEEAGQETWTKAPGTGGQGIILELGTSLGISTLALALAAPERRVVTVEGCPALAAIARENLRNHGAANAEVLNMEFSSALDLLRKEGTEVSLAFIDGNHRGEALKQYVRTIRAMGEEMIIVADDIHMNREMYSAWCSLVVPPAPAAPQPAARQPRQPQQPHRPGSPDSTQPQQLHQPRQPRQPR